MSKSAIITGITGQDGSFLAEMLLSQGYEVHGVVRRTSFGNLGRIQKILNDRKLKLHHGDLSDQGSIDRVVSIVKPTEFYNLGAQSFVGESFHTPINTIDVTGVGAVRCLEAIRHLSPETRFYQASSSEMFGRTSLSIQNETAPFHPQSPYGCAKVLAHHAVANYRDAYGIFASCGICFNHESERRGFEFVTRKITRAVAMIANKRQEVLKLGNINAVRDWGHANDFVRGMYLCLQQDSPDDFVFATGEAHSVAEFCELAFDAVGLNWSDHVEYDDDLKRPSDIEYLSGDSMKARTNLGWTPEVGFGFLVRGMVAFDMNEVEREGRK